MRTEANDARYRNLDMLDTAEVAGLILDAQEAGLAAVRAALDNISAAADAMAARLRTDADGRLVYAGAGTSIRLGVQDGVELIPTFGWTQDRLGFLIAGGTDALTRAIEGAEDNAAQGRADTTALSVSSSDAVIALSASGATPYTIGACEAARDAGALTVAIANNADSPLLAAAEHRVLLDSGAEPVGGSTRMTAGTTQKVTLNLLSTLTMIRLNRTYGGYMVDVLPTNDKLKRRVRRMVMEIANVDEAAADAALTASGGEAKPAVLVAGGLAIDEARALLDETDGNLRQALARAGARAGNKG